MKKTVTMTCILKSGVKVEESTKVDTKDTRVVNAIKELQRGLEESVGQKEPKGSNVTFGTTIIAVSEIAAISFKED